MDGYMERFREGKRVYCGNRTCISKNSLIGFIKMCHSTLWDPFEIIYTIYFVR